MRAGARHGDEEQAFLFHARAPLGPVRDRAGGSGDHVLGRRAAQALIFRGKPGDDQSRNMDGLELETLAPVDGHQAHGVHLQRCLRDLTQIALLREQDEIADAVERRMDRRSLGDGTSSRRKFRNCQIAMPRMRIRNRGDFGAVPGPSRCGPAGWWLRNPRRPCEVLRPAQIGVRAA